MDNKLKSEHLEPIIYVYIERELYLIDTIALENWLSPSPFLVNIRIVTEKE